MTNAISTSSRMGTVNWPLDLATGKSLVNITREVSVEDWEDKA